MPNTYSEKEYITALYKCYDEVYLNEIQPAEPKPYHYSATVRADGLSLHKWLRHRIQEIFRAINKIRESHGLELVVPYKASLSDCLEGL